jgi:hypothetical protein
VGVWPRLHAASAVALLPALALAPAVGAGVLALWLVLTRPRRPAPSRDAALVLAAVIAAVAIVHGGGWWAVLVPLAVGGALAAAVVRLDAGVTRAAAAAAGIGAAAAALGLAVVAFADASTRGFAQVATATHHPNATAALALALAAGSALALRGTWAARVAGAVGVLAGLALLVLTGSRGGLVGVAFAVAVLALLGLARLLARARRPLAGTVLLAGSTLVMLVGLQALLMAPDRLAPWLPRLWSQGADSVESTARTTGSSADLTLLQRLRLLEDPLGSSGGRLGAWKLAREMIATRPTLGFGFGAVERVYAPGAASELANPLAHPHHGILTMLLEGGALFAVAVLVLLGGFTWRLLRAAMCGDVAAALVAASFLGLVAMELLDSVLRVGAVGGVALVVLVIGAGSSQASKCATPTARPPARP